MYFGTIRQYVTIQGNVKLTMWKGGEVLYEDTVEGTEDINTEGLRLWDYQEIKFMFASPDGYLHIDFEQ